VRRLLVTANVPSSPILVNLIMEALSSSETSVLTRITRHYIPEDAILHSHRREILKSYILCNDFTDYIMPSLSHTHKCKEYTKEEMLSEQEIEQN
jgi:hypothetical protein